MYKSLVFIVLLSIISTLSPTEAQSWGGLSKIDHRVLKKAHAGDWISYRTVTNFGLQQTDQTCLITVKQIDEEGATLEIRTISSKPEPPPIEEYISFRESKISINDGQIPDNAVTVNEIDEMLTFGLQTYKCRKIMTRTQYDDNGIRISTILNVWYSEDIPVTGFLRSYLQQEEPSQITITCEPEKWSSAH